MVQNNTRCTSCIYVALHFYLSGMCYNAAYDAERAFKKAIRDELDPDIKRRLEQEYMAWKEQNPDIYKEKRETQNQLRYFTSAFEHEAFPVLFMENGEKHFGFFQWGLIPRWCRDEEKAHKLWNQCINARSETMFEKPSFRKSALDRRCVVIMTGFFEYHHQGAQKIPFFIQDAKGDQMYVGGLWEECIIDGKTWLTFTVVTVPANECMAKIHNNPKNPNRMPLVLRADQIDAWLQPTDKEDQPGVAALKSEIIQPYPADGLQYHSVPKLQGKEGVGDHPNAQVPYQYIDLDIVV